MRSKPELHESRLLADDDESNIVPFTNFAYGKRKIEDITEMQKL